MKSDGKMEVFGEISICKIQQFPYFRKTWRKLWKINSSGVSPTVMSPKTELLPVKNDQVSCEKKNRNRFENSWDIRLQIKINIRKK